MYLENFELGLILCSPLRYQKMIFHFAVASLIGFPQYQSGNPNKTSANRMKAISTNVSTYPTAVIHGITAYEETKSKDILQRHNQKHQFRRDEIITVDH
jgi:hypothetical protein